MGLYLGEKAYLRSSWNILDGFLVFVSLTDIVVSMAGGAKILGVLRVLRLLRTLRPLRLGQTVMFSVTALVGIGKETEVLGNMLLHFICLLNMRLQPEDG